MFRRAFLIAALVAGAAGAAELSISLHPENPHYFLFRQKPTVLVTSGEHYGAVINQDFDYIKYLDTLAKNGFNLTRTFVGSYVEVPGNFDITGNTLAPKPESFLAAWPRVNGKYDLTKWNEPMFARLKAFVAAASKRKIVVEINLFTPMYEDSIWAVNPMNEKNNVNGVGAVARTDLFTLKDGALTDVQDRFVRKVVETVHGFDNIYYEVCNEPYFGGITQEWHRHMAKTVADAEAALGARHLISHNYSNGSQTITDPDPRISIFNFHYSFPAESVGMNYGLKRVIGNNETGFDGTGDSIYRIQAWDFMIAGGGLFNHLDYSFTVGHEDGSFGPLPDKQPGGGTPALRNQLRILHTFLEKMDFIYMAPAPQVVQSLEPKTARVRVLAEPGRNYAAYLYHVKQVGEHGKERDSFVVESGERKATLTLDLPAGNYSYYWLDTKTGSEIGKQKLKHSGGAAKFEAPSHNEDIALRISSSGK